jgi:hypothetical protein
VIAPLVWKVFETFGPLKDSETQKPLFNAMAWKTTKGVMKAIKHGFVSNPSVIALYHKVGYDKNGLPLYHCCHGTNSAEGGVHRPIRDSMPKSGVSLKHAVMCLKSFCLVHNLKVSVSEHSGKCSLC